jgi:type I restriction enzyme S subunit
MLLAQAATGASYYASSTPLTRNRFKERFFLALEIPLPTLTEQSRLVARIKALATQIHEARSLRQQARREAEVFAAAVPNLQFAGRWPEGRLDDVCLLITDGTHQTPRYVDEGAIFLSAQNVKPFRFMPGNHRKVSMEDFHAYTVHNKPRKEDVLLTRVGAGIGEAALVDQDIEFAIYVSLALIRPDDQRLLPEFLVHWLNSTAGQAYCRSETLGKGHSQGNLNLKLLRGFKLPVPPISEQRRIVRYLDDLKEKTDSLKALQTETSTELDALMPSILDKAFRGELTS